MSMRLDPLNAVSARALTGRRVLFRLVMLFPLLGCHPDGRADEQEPKQQGDTEKERPVILLTGFEPYGKDRSTNASWEGVKRLDGQQRNGFRLVCKQMRVIWGAPLEQLEKSMSDEQPVAIFSFGQGGPGGFTLESKASNERGAGLDNSQQRAPKPTIAEDGPAEVRATIDFSKLSQLLSEKGYPIQVSEDAGSYLCEEALYSLEYLKSTKQLDVAVLFCHVPPIGAEIQGQRVDADYVQRFVEDLLEIWSTEVRDKAPSPTARPKGEKQSQNARQNEVEQFVRRYFRTWSNQEMDAYGECFLPEACIQYVDAEGRLWTQSRAKFLQGQRSVHLNAPHRAVEVPESIDIRFEAQLARAVVYWKLTAGPRTEFGYDHFTLVRHDGKWRIANLVFYTTKSSE